MQRSSVRMLALAGTIVAAVGCGGAARQASAEVARIDATGSAAVADTGRAPRPGANEADVRFMRGMIGHHAQALEMTDLVPTRAARADIRLMAERIAVSQHDEIAAMERWLRSRGEAVESADAHQHHGAAGGGHAGMPGMPGMATPDEMARLAASTGAEFDRLFLELMIRHHEGALVMVAALLASPGGGQDAEVYQLASDVEADQRAEIARMQRLQNGPAPAPRR